MVFVSVFPSRRKAQLGICAQRAPSALQSTDLRAGKSPSGRPGCELGARGHGIETCSSELSSKASLSAVTPTSALFWLRREACRACVCEICVCAFLFLKCIQG